MWNPEKELKAAILANASYPTGEYVESGEGIESCRATQSLYPPHRAFPWWNPEKELKAPIRRIWLPIPNKPKWNPEKELKETRKVWYRQAFTSTWNPEKELKAEDARRAI